MQHRVCDKAERLLLRQTHFGEQPNSSKYSFCTAITRERDETEAAWRDNHSIQSLRINYAATTRRISFKLAVMTYRSIHDTSPSYLFTSGVTVFYIASRRRLRSPTSHRLDVPPVRLSIVGKGAFPVSMPPSGTTCLRYDRASPEPGVGIEGRTHGTKVTLTRERRTPDLYNMLMIKNPDIAQQYIDT